MARDFHDVIRQGAELVIVGTDDEDGWVAPTLVNAPVLITTHGFTAHGRILQKLAKYFQQHGFCSLIFNYDSYMGIESAAHELCDRLKSLREELRRFGFVLIAHSMGGLVVRRARQLFDDDLKQGLKGIVVMGTPNNGALTRGPGLSFMLDVAEKWGDIHPFLRTPGCRAADELRLADKAKLVDNINALDRLEGLRTPVLSISGGLEFLEFGGVLISRLRNRILQRLIGEKPNDGLVCEASANLTWVLDGTMLSAAHRNDYSDFLRTNHSNIIKNQGIANIVLKWVSPLFESA